MNEINSMDRLSQLKVEVSLHIGKTRLGLAAIEMLDPGDVLELHNGTEDEVALLAGETVIAYGNIINAAPHGRLSFVATRFPPES